MVRERVANLLEAAWMAFDMEKYDKCVQWCDHVLSIDPQYSVAILTKAWAEIVRTGGCDKELIWQSIQEWKGLTAWGKEAAIPYTDLFRFPTEEEWRLIEDRLAK